MADTDSMAENGGDMQKLETALERLERAVSTRLLAKPAAAPPNAEAEAALAAAERHLGDVTRERDRLSAALVSARQQNAALEDMAKNFSGGLDTAIDRLKTVIDG